jgi:hypothetical protein
MGWVLSLSPKTEIILLRFLDTNGLGLSYKYHVSMYFSNVLSTLSFITPERITDRLCIDDKMIMMEQVNADSACLNN